jgi:hypothetical protein
MTDRSKNFIDDHRWDLAKHFLDRADHAANMFRGFLFSAATAGIGFIMYVREDELRSHLLPLILLGVAAGLVAVSWDIQKGKAIRRFEALRDGEAHYEKEGYISNYILDRIVGLFITVAVFSEIVIAVNEVANN